MMFEMFDRFRKSPPKQEREEVSPTRKGFDPEVEKQQRAEIQSKVLKRKQRIESDQDAEHKANLFAKERGFQDYDAWVADGIKRINFDGLKGVYGDFARRAGVPVEKMNFIPKEDVAISSAGLSGGAFYDPEANMLSINPRSQRGSFLRLVEDGVDAKEASKKTMLQIYFELTHEYTHATGVNHHSSTTKDDGMITREVIIGYQKSTVMESPNVQGGWRHQHMLLNEGITTRIGLNAASEYLRRFPLTLETGETITPADFRAFRTAIDGPADYALAVYFTDRLVEHIAQQCNVPTEIVWGGVIQGYYAGHGISKEMETLFDKIIGKKFSEKLRETPDDDMFSEESGGEYLTELAEKYKFPPMSDELKKQVEFLLQNVGDSPFGDLY